MTKELTKDQIDQVFEKAEHQSDYTIGLYRLVYGDEWEKIAHLNGFPAVSRETSEYIFNRAIKFDAAHHPDVMKGGLWMNNGFSTDQTLKEWAVSYNEADIVYKEAESE